MRQSSLTLDVYRYYKLFQVQTQNTGGLTDTPPSAPVGNVHNVANPTQVVVGYFTASGVFTKPVYIDRKDYQGVPYGYNSIKGYPQGELFLALHDRLPMPETPPSDTNNYFIDQKPRPPTALCASVDQRTPVKPGSWPD